MPATSEVLEDGLGEGGNVSGELRGHGILDCHVRAVLDLLPNLARALTNNVGGPLLLFGPVPLRQQWNFHAGGTTSKFHRCGKFAVANSNDGPALR